MKKIQGPAAKSVRVAVIEEDADNLYSMRFILQSLGYQVDSFGVNPTLPSAVAEFGPEIILVDMMIPGGAGLEILQRLKKGGLKQVRVIAVTAEAVSLSEEELLRAGADEVLMKPYSVTELQEKLNS